MKVPTDAECVKEAQAGSLEAFGLLYTRHKDWVYGYALSRVRENEIAVDLVQDVFTRALEGLARFRPDQNFGAWLNGITRHVVADYLRRDYQRKEKLPAMLEKLNPGERGAAYREVEANFYTGQELADILAELHSDQRALIRLRLIEGRSNGETALSLYGQDNDETRRKVTVGLYKALQAARQIGRRNGLDG